MHRWHIIGPPCISTGLQQVQRGEDEHTRALLVAGVTRCAMRPCHRTHTTLRTHVVRAALAVQCDGALDVHRVELPVSADAKWPVCKLNELDLIKTEDIYRPVRGDHDVAIERNLRRQRGRVLGRNVVLDVAHCHR